MHDRGRRPENRRPSNGPDVNHHGGHGPVSATGRAVPPARGSWPVHGTGRGERFTVKPLAPWVALPVLLLGLAGLGLAFVAGVTEKTNLLMVALAVCALIVAWLGVGTLVKYVRFRKRRR
jgi:hypothetical protein